MSRIVAELIEQVRAAHEVATAEHERAWAAEPAFVRGIEPEVPRTEEALQRRAQALAARRQAPVAAAPAPNAGGYNGGDECAGDVGWMRLTGGSRPVTASKGTRVGPQLPEIIPQLRDALNDYVAVRQGCPPDHAVEVADEVARWASELLDWLDDNEVLPQHLRNPNRWVLYGRSANDSQD